MSATITQQIQDAIPVSQISDHIPGRPHKSTVQRWLYKGVRGTKLESVVIGGRRMVTPQALDQFLQRLNSGNTAVEVDPADDHVRRGREACAALASLGY